VSVRHHPATEVSETLVVAAPIERVWALLSDTGGYGDWVESCIAVTYHHGEAALGGVYREVGHGLGPLRTRTSWTIAELDAPHFRRDTGSGMPLVSGLESIFELETIALPLDDAPDAATQWTWRNRYRPALGALGRRLDALQQGELRGMMRRSMDRLAQLAVADPVPPA
jgi:uncharacterized protein YndB with AHSA1/START domain